MSKLSFSVFLPVRRGSERVLNKNTRRFGNLQNGLLELKLKQLVRTEKINEIVISTNDPNSLEFSRSFNKDSRIVIDSRPEALCTSETDLQDLIVYSSRVCTKDHILWTHATSPFFDSVDYDEAVEIFQKKFPGENDSLLTGRSYKDFLVDPVKNQLVNNKTDLLWPRTQDLQELFEVNNAVFLAPRKLFSKGLRMGKNPFFLYSSKLASFDIDDMEDFKIAEALYERISR